MHRRLWMMALALLVTGALGELRAGTPEDLEAVIFGGARALREDVGYRALDDERTRWKAMRETVSLMLTSVTEATVHAGEVVAETPLEPDWTCPQYADQLMATAERLGPDHLEALTQGARTAIETFRLDQVAEPETPLRTLLAVSKGLEARSGIPGVPLEGYRRAASLADASELDALAEAMRGDLRAR